MPRPGLRWKEPKLASRARKIPLDCAYFSGETGASARRGDA